ncbi:von Willebrand factor type A domain protein [hydrothermal vent metagenome]|uniref:von Willebrand factor type A domain protein n=1 Tax=hydrothermal vent metagenome TaxID=652676 RepID=A0A3B0TQ05_9ZZZZ
MNNSGVFVGFFSFLRQAGIVLGLGFLMSAPTIAQERMMIVMDGSGSMWGQINGVTKLEIARQTLRQVLAGVPDAMELGLIAYGHRQKGNCGDIELIVKPAPGTGAQIASEVDKMRFLGKTPLGAAVKFAAEKLRYTEERSTVVLITDGLETCGVKICELAKALEEAGVDFTAHVVGFGLSKEEGRQISCLAEETGGRYFAANDAAELVAALNQTVAATISEVRLIAKDQDDNQVAGVELDWKVSDSSGNIVFETRGTTAKSALKPGEYSVAVSGPDIAGGAQFTVGKENGDQVIYVPVELNLLEASLDAPDQVAAGAQFAVSWQGPDDERDYVTIVKPETREGGFINYAYTKQGSPAEIEAPDELGVYQLRYVHGPSDKTLATRKITVTAVSASLEAPDEIFAGAEFKVDWTGPNNRRDYITIVAAGADEGDYNDYAYTSNGSPAKIEAPEAPGDYEVRYVLGQSDSTLASLPISVKPVSASLEAPDEIFAGSEFKVVWTGPNNRRDYITIVELGADEGEYNDYAYTRNGSPAKIAAPQALGKYEVRYVLGQSDKTLAFIAVNLVAASAVLSAPESVVAGEVVEVIWSGPANRNDFIEIVEAGASPDARPLSKARTSQGSPLSLFAPDEAGQYEIRYKMRNNGRVLARVALNVE